MSDGIWRRKFERERRARQEAESLLESKAGELWVANEKLRALAEMLEQRVEERTIELRQARDQALNAERRAEESSKAKSHFLASMSHEIRTPLNAILGYGRLLTETATAGTEAATWTSHLLRNAEHMASLLGDVLDLARIEADQFDIEHHSFALMSLLEEVLALARPQISEKGLTLSLSLKHPLPMHLVSDALRIRQILLNLINNAMKFTHQGGITIEISTEEASPRLRLEVIDTGVGIAPDRLTDIWQPFTQGHDNQQEWFGGTGLGLDICRRLAAQLEGEMGVSSSPGVGSRFWLSLPLAEDALSTLLSEDSEHPLSPESATPDLGGVRILVVDDSSDNRRLLQLILERAGAAVQTCCDGQQAVTLQLAARHSTDIILMDLQMPVMDGFQATSLLRAAGTPIPIIAISADATAQTRRRVREAGFTDRLTKPVPPGLLLSRIDALVPRERQPPPPNRPSPQPTLELPEELMQAFFEDLQARHAQLSEARVAQDTAQLERLLHQLAGAAGSYGYPQLGDRSQTILQLLRDGASPEPHLAGILSDIQHILSSH